MENLQIVEEQQTNFNNLKTKLEVIMKKCNKKTFIQEYDEIPEIIKARKVEQYLLDDGLYVCLVFNDKEECIDMLISATPIYENSEWKDRNGNSHIGTRYTGASGIEFTFGGNFNSLFFNNDWYLQEQIGLFENNNGRMTKVANTVPTMVGGYDLQFLIYGSINKYNFDDLSDFESHREKCDIEKIIENYQTNHVKEGLVIENYKSCLKKINNNVDKKGLLKAFLDKFNKNNKIIKEKNNGGKQI